MGINVALDGPSGAGKSTIAKKLAARLEYVYVDTGALYRSIALFVISKGADPKSEEQVVPLLEGLDIKLVYVDNSQRVMCNGEDVSDKIRTPEISMGASGVSAIPVVRKFLFDLQQNIAKENNIIMDGRDIGTVVLPDADVKIYLTATPEERANRRFKELQEKGDSSTYEQVLEDIVQRDYNDTHREIAPLKKADDAVEVDSTNLDLDGSVEAIYNIIIENTAKKKSRIAKEFAPLRPVKRGKKQSHFKMFWYRILRFIVIRIYRNWYKLTYEGMENLTGEGSMIFASNHRSYADPVLIALPNKVPFSFMAKEELFKQNIFFTALIRFFGAFPVTRGKGDTAAIDTSLEKLEKGRNLVIFPEGTRSKDGKVGKGKTGVALIAAMAQVPIVPVGITFEGVLCRKKKVVVRFGKPIIPSELGIDSTNPHNLKKLKNEIMENITKLVY